MTQPRPPAVPLTRRRFLAVAAAGPAALLAACGNTSSTAPPPTVGRTLDDATLRSRPGAPTETATIGLQPLGLDSGRDGFLYVPPGYRADHPAPLVVLLHGAGRSAIEWSTAPLPELLDAKGIVALIPSSRGTTWDLSLLGGFGPDVKFIDSALALAFRRCNVDPQRIALAGFSDGATYSLSMGVANGDLFNELIAFSPGYFAPPGTRGTPRVFVAHGTSDPVLSFAYTRDHIVPTFERAGYDVRFVEFDGGHTVTRAVAEEAMQWFLAP